MSYTLYLIELILATIVCMSLLISYEFSKATDQSNNRLKELIIALFLCKVYIYGGAAILFLLYPPDKMALIRLIVLNVPMFIVMILLYRYIKTHNS